MSDNEKWVPCPRPQAGNTLRWDEPLWAPPTKPRGKRDKIGEQQITAELISLGELLELKVISVKKLSSGDAPITVKEGDEIKRRQSSIAKGSCHKREA
jgi:hypothetical protein